MRRNSQPLAAYKELASGLHAAKQKNRIGTGIKQMKHSESIQELQLNPTKNNLSQ
jgi:hypothetical protein